MDVQITRRTAIAAVAAAWPVAGSLKAHQRHHVFVHEQEAGIAELLAFIIAHNLDCDVTWMSGCRDTAITVLKRHRDRFTMSALCESADAETTFRLLNGQAKPSVLRWPMAYRSIRDSMLRVTGTARLAAPPDGWKDRIHGL